MGAISIWHWIILLVAVSPFAAVIYVAVSRYRHEKATAGHITPGFIGWLCIFAAAQWIGLARLLVELGKYYTPETLRGLQSYPLLGWLEGTVNAISVIISVAVIGLMLKKSKKFAPLYKAAYVWTLISIPIIFLINYFLLSNYYRLPSAAQAYADGLPEVLGAWIGISIAGGAWLLYVIRSRRVQATFIH